MTAPRYQVALDGITVDAQDFNLFAAEAARAEDYVLAELLRLPLLFGGTTVAKAIQPYMFRVPSVGTGSLNVSTVNTGGATGSVNILPFRAVIGTRTAVSNAASTDQALDTTPQLAWRDVRSSVYAVSDNGSTLGHLVALAANASGNPRWDLVYATFTVDTPQATSTIFVKPPGANVGTPTTISRNYLQTITINVVTGTPGASPALPSIPADNLGLNTYNIPLAYVAVPNGFNGSSSVTTQAICNAAPTVPLAQQPGQVNVAPASANWDPAVIGTTQMATWGSTGTRPVWGINQGINRDGKSIVFALNSQTGASTTWNVGDGGIIDQSIDWRNRFFRVFIAFNAAAHWAMEHSSTTLTHPSAGNFGQNSSLTWQFGQSFVVDDAAVLSITTRNGAVVCQANGTILTNYSGGATAIYVDTSSGALKLYASGAAAGGKLFFWIDASGQMDNV